MIAETKFSNKNYFQINDYKMMNTAIYYYRERE